MKLAILLWVYRDVDVCVNRARWLRRLNPDTPILCLYGGPMPDVAVFRNALRGFIDDFHAFEEDWTPYDKWIHGDRMIASWFREQESRLDWDTIFVAQWDLVLLAPLRDLCGTLGPGQLLLPGLRSVSEVSHFWNWVQPGDGHLGEYDAFRDLLADRGLVLRDPLCCNFLAAALPRPFLERYAWEAPDTGFLEYKLPMLAQAWGFDFCRDHRLDPVWVHERRRSRIERTLLTLHAESHAVRSSVLAVHRMLPNGCRAFHPYRGIVPFWSSRVNAA